MEVILEIIDIQSKAEGTLITLENSAYTVIIADKGSPLGKYRNANIDFNTKLKFNILPFDYKVESLKDSTIYDICALHEMQINKNERGKTYTIAFSSSSTENDFFKLEATVVTKDQNAVKDFKYGSLYHVVGSFIGGDNA